VAFERYLKSGQVVAFAQQRTCDSFERRAMDERRRGREVQDRIGRILYELGILGLRGMAPSDEADSYILVCRWLSGAGCR
jgi:hypothetical protein